MSALGDLAERIDAVVVGASAGGMDALSVVLSALPETLRAPVFVVLHQPRDRPSLLVELFETRCVRPVREPEDKEPIEAGTVYFAPPDYHLLVDDGAQLALSADEPVNYARPSIDVLFESASDAYGSRLLGIVLTGANHDGAAGLSAVDRAGGLAIVQDPKTAQVEVMPAAALAATRGARALPLPEIADVLRTLGLPGG